MGTSHIQLKRGKNSIIIFLGIVNVNRCQLYSISTTLINNLWYGTPLLCDFLRTCKFNCFCLMWPYSFFELHCQPSTNWANNLRGSSFFSYFYVLPVVLCCWGHLMVTWQSHNISLTFVIITLPYKGHCSTSRDTGGTRAITEQLLLGYQYSWSLWTTNKLVNREKNGIFVDQVSIRTAEWPVP